MAKCGQGCTDDELSPTCVSSLLGLRIEGVAAGLWHTVCISADGDVYVFGGNQFGQLGTGDDQAEVSPTLGSSHIFPTLLIMKAKIMLRLYLFQPTMIYWFSLSSQIISAQSNTKFHFSNLTMKRLILCTS